MMIELSDFTVVAHKRYTRHAAHRERKQIVTRIGLCELDIIYVLAVIYTFHLLAKRCVCIYDKTVPADSR